MPPLKLARCSILSGNTKTVQICFNLGPNSTAHKRHPRVFANFKIGINNRFGWLRNRGRRVVWARRTRRIRWRIKRRIRHNVYAIFIKVHFFGVLALESEPVDVRL